VVDNNLKKALQTELSISRYWKLIDVSKEERLPGLDIFLGSCGALYSASKELEFKSIPVRLSRIFSDTHAPEKSLLSLVGDGVGDKGFIIRVGSGVSNTVGFKMDGSEPALDVKGSEMLLWEKKDVVV
jgi:hypothetical protein